MRSHVTNAFEFETAGLLLAGDGEHAIRVLGAFAEPAPAPSPEKEATTMDAAVYQPYFDGLVRGDQQDPDERPFHPMTPAPHLTRDGVIEFLSRDWSGIDLSTVVIPELPESPGDEPPPETPPSLDPVLRWRTVLGPDARDGNDVVELIDGPETFRSMHAAIRTATGPEHYVYLLGWWLDLDEPLDVPTTGPPCPPAPRTGPSTIRNLFAAASAAGVQVRMMLWDQTGSAKNTAEVAFVNSLANGAAILDNHQLAFFVGAHHQKMLVVKGSVGLIAFCGGIDINTDRICATAAAGGGGRGSGSGSGSAPETPPPDAVTAASSGGSGGVGSPLHDVHCRIAGPAAHDLLGVFAKRWFSNTDRVALDTAKGGLRGISEPVPGSAGPAVVRIGETYNATANLPAPPSPSPWTWWPAAGSRTFTDRTVQEILLPVIAGARRFIYIEEQYLIGMCAAEAIRNALPNVDHVTILIAASDISDVPRRWEFRRRFIDRITSHPDGSKLRVFFLCTPGPPVTLGDHTYVHAKMLVADDEIAVIGSANINRRGWEHDSEIVAGIVGNGRDGTPLARKIRTRLWAEHLGVAESAVADPIASKGLWLTATTRRVCPYNTSGGTDPITDGLIGEGTIDPPAPLATAPCCAIHVASCPGGVAPPTPTPTPTVTPTPTPAPSPTPTPTPTPTATAVDRWGNYDLRRADDDAEPKWAGATRTAATGDQMPAAGTDGFVRRLQNDLLDTGFLLVGTPDGSFGRLTEWAVREFQIYAKMGFLAEENTAAGAPAVYSDRLSQVANTAIYTGPVSGVLNARTRAALTEWLANDWRCAVVVEARTGTTVNHANLWGKDDLRSSAPRMVSRDWSGHYTLPAGVSAGDRMDLGDWQSAGHGGPSSRAPSHTRADAELTPDALVGVAVAALSAPQLSTYKAVRAVSEVECMGFLDSLNAWDNAIMSLGPCHWTLGLISGATVDRGELSAYLAYLRQFEPADFTTAVGFFGARANLGWANAAGIANGAPTFNAGLRKYTAWMEQENESGGFTATPATAGDANYFRTWHWFHRFAMAGRTVQGFRRRMWDMARIRLRDIRATPWGAGPPAVPDVPVAGGTPRAATIGDVFTSEQALAMVMRWHVYRPAHMITGGNAGPRLRNALSTAAIPAAAGAPSTWTNAHEQSLIDGLTAEAAALGDANLVTTLGEVRNWHSWGAGGGPRRYTLPHTIANLSADRNSLNFDGGGLPPAP